MSLVNFPNKIQVVLGSIFDGSSKLDGLNSGDILILTKVDSLDLWTENGTNVSNRSTNRIRFRPIGTGTLQINVEGVKGSGGSNQWGEAGTSYRGWKFSATQSGSNYTFRDLFSYSASGSWNWTTGTQHSNDSANYNGAIFSSIASYVETSDHYWISSLSSTFSSSLNWSLTSGGAGGASIPDSSQIAIFDGNGQGSCQFNVPVAVQGIRVLSDYSGTLQLSGYPFSVGFSDATFSGGYFSGNSSLIDISGNLIISNTDFTSTSNLMTLYGNFSYSTGSFSHNDGTVKFAANNEINGGGIRFWNLSIDSDSTGPRIDSSCFVGGSLIFDRGVLRQGTDGTVHVWGDVTCNSTGGAWSSYHNAVVQMEGLRTQIINTNGGILPTLVVDKTTSNKVILGGSPPLYINGDLFVMDGTMSTAGIDLEVGRGSI